MKNLLLLLMAAGGAVSATAQAPIVRSHGDSLMSRWVIDVNLLGGLASQTFSTMNTTTGYPNALNLNTGQLKYENGYSYGADVQLGFFFGRKRHFGVGTGLMFVQQHGDAILDNYHVEYQATDGAGNTFRQVVSGHDVREAVTTNSFNIPVVLKYKNRFSKHWGFTADAGAVVNLQARNNYTTHASFDYEAIYKFAQNGDGGTTAVYDNAPVPSVGDWMITRAEFLKNNPHGNVQEYFAAKRALGYRVGEGIAPGTRTGNTTYTQASVGLLLQPSFNYFFSDHVALNMGVYYMLQPFKNNAQTGYRLTDGSGNYSSVMNTVTASTNQEYGVNLGVRFFLGRKRTPLSIASVYQVPPTQCGVCDGSIWMTGLFPDKQVTIDYSLNGAAATQYETKVQPDGKVTIPNLCAGAYTGITASIKRDKATTTAVTIADPVLRISQTAVNAKTAGACDGSITFGGLYAGKSATITYSLNGNVQPSFTSVVAADRTVMISNLCEGKYTGIVATIGSCTANGTDFTITAPTPPPVVQPATVVTTTTESSISAPILFNVNKTTVHNSSLPVIEEAVAEMKENKNMKITIDGHADASGPEPANRVLSLNRANSVKRELTKRGINGKRIKTKGHGSSIPAATNNTKEGKHENRRAVMTPNK